MSKYITIFLILTFATLTFAVGARRVNLNGKTGEGNTKWWTDSKAITYTSKSFDANVGKENFVVIQFCATFSKDCEALAPEYDKLAEMYTGANAKRTDVIVSKIDGWTFNSLSQTYSVKKFPTIRFFNKGDPSSSDEYNDDLTADKLSGWIENLVKVKSGQGAGEQKTEETKKENNDAAKTETKQADTTNAAATDSNQNNNDQAKDSQADNTNNQANTDQANNQQQEQNKQAESAKPTEVKDIQKELKLVLNTTLLQAQFDEVQKQLNTLKENLEKSITENFKKVETLAQSVEGHKNEFRNIIDTLSNHGDKFGQISTTLNTHKDDIKNYVTGQAEGHFSGLKDTVTSIKNKVFERKIEESTGPGFMHNLIFMAIGGAIGGVAVFFLASGGNKKRRSMLD